MECGERSVNAYAIIKEMQTLSRKLQKRTAEDVLGSDKTAGREWLGGHRSNAGTGGLARGRAVPREGGMEVQDGTSREHLLVVPPHQNGAHCVGLRGDRHNGSATDSAGPPVSPAACPAHAPAPWSRVRHHYRPAG